MTTRDDSKLPASAAGNRALRLVYEAPREMAAKPELAAERPKRPSALELTEIQFTPEQRKEYLRLYREGLEHEARLDAARLAEEARLQEQARIQEEASKCQEEARLAELAELAALAAQRAALPPLASSPTVGGTSGSNIKLFAVAVAGLLVGALVVARPWLSSQPSIPPAAVVSTAVPNLDVRAQPATSPLAASARSPEMAPVASVPAPPPVKNDPRPRAHLNSTQARVPIPRGVASSASPTTLNPQPEPTAQSKKRIPLARGFRMSGESGAKEP
ncbi:MAG TPA: hypothetical protein VFQ61_15450 [Polyangiaceae bacterium]|nr:hypothetical protein [Polyangiaceae bacterium]